MSSDRQSNYLFKLHSSFWNKCVQLPFLYCFWVFMIIENNHKHLYSYEEVLSGSIELKIGFLGCCRRNSCK